MKIRIQALACTTLLSLTFSSGVATAIEDCPADHIADGYTCTMFTGEGKTGGYFRITIPSDWDGDLVVVNHGFDLDGRKIRPHETCSHNRTIACEVNADCGTPAMGERPRFCNDISYLGLDEILLPMGKAVAAPTHTDTGWATFHSAKDIKDILSFMKKDSGYGDQLKRVIVTGFSGGGAVTVDATLKLKIDGAVPLCAASGGGLPTWDVAQDVRLVYDYLCSDVVGGSFGEAPDEGIENSLNSDQDALSMGFRVDTCLGVVGIAPDDGFQDARLSDFIALTEFTGHAAAGGDDFNVAAAMGFATLGMGDFVHDPERLKGARIGLNDTIDYSTIGDTPLLSADFDANVERMTYGAGRKRLRKAYWPDYTKGKGKKVAYPILGMAGVNDWLVIPEFQRVFTDALTDGGKAFTQTWIDTYGHCVFSEQEVTAVFNKFFEWMGPDGGPYGPQPTANDVENACLALPGGVDGDTCNFNTTFSPPALYDRIPPRSDWPAAALP